MVLIDLPLPKALVLGARSTLFRRVSLAGLRIRPEVLAALLIAGIALGIAMQWAVMTGPLVFDWQAAAGGWLGAMLGLAACWLAVRRHPGEPVSDHGLAPAEAATLFALLVVQAVLIGLLAWIPALLWSQEVLSNEALGVQWLAWGLTPLAYAWIFIAALRLLLAHTPARPVPRGAVAGLLLASTVSTALMPPPPYWYPDPEAQSQSEPGPRFSLRQEDFEAQARAFDRQMLALAPQRAGVIDLYAINFAPYASEDVFMRESRLVDEVMRSRFDAQGRAIQLVNNARTATELPWATPLNLQRAIQSAAARMDRDEDILFIHLTSHGARNGKLAAQFWPLGVEAVDPAQLRTWLDQAGVRWRVISVSACYSGSWIAPLADAQTLVMTAADAEHTSYGCGRKSELTYFGRALYDEQLRLGLSFERAHEAARAVIQKREQEAGKKDGFSNPQIHMGGEIRTRLAGLEARLQSAASRAP